MIHATVFQHGMEAEVVFSEEREWTCCVSSGVFVETIEETSSTNLQMLCLQSLRSYLLQTISLKHNSPFTVLVLPQLLSSEVHGHNLIHGCGNQAGSILVQHGLSNLGIHQARRRMYVTRQITWAHAGKCSL